MRKKHPEWDRPYKAPGGNGFFGIAIVSGIVIILASLTELDKGGYISLAIFLLVGFLCNLLMDKYRSKNPKKLALKTLTPEDIDKVNF